MSDTSASIAFQRYREVRFFGSLNGLRVLCVFMVMWHHSPARGSLDDPNKLLNAGYTGVDFFFVLSGFLITTLLLREEARHGRFSLPDFYWRRILRIVPLYFFVVSAVSGYYILVQGEWQYLSDLPYYYLFLSNFMGDDGIRLLSITWSLAVEEQYYLVWPVILLLLPVAGRIRIWALIAIIAAFVVLAASALDASMAGRQPHALWWLPLSSYAGLLIGSLLGLLLHRPRGFALVHGFAGRWFAPLVAFALLALSLRYYPGPLKGWGNLLVHSMMALCIASIVAREDNLLRPILSFRPVARIGEISYGIYLYHLIGLYIASVLLMPLLTGLAPKAQAWVLTLGMVVVTLTISEISFRYFESYFLRFKNRRPVWRARVRSAEE